VRFEDANDLFRPGYLPFESGYQELDDGKWVVAGLTRMPGCRAKMVDWWFSWLGDIEWYRLWHPTDHVYSGWENRVGGKYIGASHLVHEYLAGKDGPLYKLRIDFHDPSKTFDAAKYKTSGHFAVCARPGLLEEPIHVGQMLLLGAGAIAVAGSAIAASGAAFADEIVIGASLPLSGPLAGFGNFQQWGYKRAVDEVNKAGGITVDGSKKMVKLMIRDDKTDPNATASNTETLLSRDHAVAMLGSCTPALVNAGALVAERAKKPLVTGCDPLEAFKSVRKWNYVWDIFFDEPDLAAAPLKALADLGVETNKKVAIWHDNGPDGQVVGGKFWPELAKQAGYEVVQNAEFPVDNAQFTSIIGEAKSKGADVVLVDAITPQAIAIRKQMAAGGYTPKVLDIEKGAEPVQFAEALGKLSDGVLVGGYWDPSFPYPGAADLAKDFESETKLTNSQHIADSYPAAQVLLDAIAAAGSTDPTKINVALASTDKAYVVGPVKFDKNHTAKLPIVALQWQGGKTVVVWPKSAKTGDFLFPLP
jgi:branched-chain amino acid transport system substrate-binding protein